MGKPLPIEYTLKHLSQGKPCEWIGLLEKGDKAHSYQAKIVDPNTFETKTYTGDFHQSNIHAVFNYAVKDKIDKMTKIASG